MPYNKNTQISKHPNTKRHLIALKVPRVLVTSDSAGLDRGLRVEGQVPWEYLRSTREVLFCWEYTYEPGGE